MKTEPLTARQITLLLRAKTVHPHALENGVQNRREYHTLMTLLRRRLLRGVRKIRLTPRGFAAVDSWMRHNSDALFVKMWNAGALPS